jgi:anthranilate phosphoribosyltransferase
MSISHYIKTIGRGKEGAKALSKEQANDLLSQILLGQCSDLEVGAFCLAMRIKGETANEVAGFLEAIQQQSQLLSVVNQDLTTPTVQETTPSSTQKSVIVVLPSYNGARKQALLTPLLAFLLARQGITVLIHGHNTEATRVTSEQILQAMGHPTHLTSTALTAGEVHYRDLATFCPGLARLLEVRKVVGLRNSAHSLVKMMNPFAEDAWVVSSYTHPEYLISMTEAFEHTQQTAFLMRGTEGEPVADARRTPAIDVFNKGQVKRIQEAQSGTLLALPQLPSAIDAHTTAGFIQAVLKGEIALPKPIEIQVEKIVQEVRTNYELS